MGLAFSPFEISKGKPHGGKQTRKQELPANETLLGDNVREKGEVFYGCIRQFFTLRTETHFLVFKLNRQRNFF